MAKLIKFEVENFLSIKEKTTFSMEADNIDNNLNEILIKTKEENLLLSPLAAIYGNNATGKTNLLKAMGNLSLLIKITPLMTVGQKIPRTPFKSNEKKPTKFTIIFIKNDIRYAYFVSFNDTHILSEGLYNYPNKKQKKIFERVFENNEVKLIIPREYSSKFKGMDSKMLKNKLFLGTLSEWAEIKEIKDVIEFFKEDLIINVNNEAPDGLHYTVKTLGKKKAYKKIFLELLKEVNPSIKDFDAKIKKFSYSESNFPVGMPEEVKMLLSKGESFRIEVKIHYLNDGLSFDLNEESKGIQKLFEIGGQIIDVLTHGKILLYDELETSFHPIIAQKLINLFQNKIINNKGAQLIFSTHDVNLLNLDFLRKDQIWFTEKGKETKYVTKLTPLSQIRGIRKDENIRTKYLKGAYTKIQVLNIESLKTIFKIEKGE